jgi:hypothetical protein
VVVVCEEEDIVPGEARGFKSTNSSQPTNWVHVSFCACRWRAEIVNGRIPDSLVRCGGFGALENGTCQLSVPVRLYDAP